MTTFSDLVYMLGGAPVLAGLPFSKSSKYYFVDPANGSDGNDGLSPATALAGLAAALAKCVANQHDTVFYIAGSSGLTLSAALDWNLNYTHLIGLCAPSHAAQRARIFQLSTLTGASPLITISATGCIWKNLYIFQGVADATSLIDVSVTGGRNYFENVHFAGGGHATQAVDGGASLKLDGAEENLFRHCTIGVDTIAAATGMVALLVDGAAPRNTFEDCLFTLYSGNAGCAFVEIVDNAGFDRYLLFRRCLFINDNTEAGKILTSAFVIPPGMGSVTHRIILDDCAILGAAEVESNNRGLVYMNRGAITAGGNSGLMQVTNTT
jgi:hypothetical protein